MNFEQPLQQIQTFLQRFSYLTCIWCCYTDPSGKPLILPEDTSMFCSRMFSDSVGGIRCINCISANCVQAHKGKNEYRTSRCHAGVNEIVVPVYYRFELVGNIVFSSIPMRHLPEHALERAVKDMKDLVVTESLRRSFLRIRQMSVSEISSCAKMLLSGVSAIYAEADPHAESCGLEQRLENYIRANYTERLTLEKIARALSVGKTKLCAVTAMHGSTVMTLVNEIRIEEAKKLLETTCLRIRDVSEQVGVSDPNYFTKLFRAYTGETPRDYQKRLSTRKPGRTAR